MSVIAHFNTLYEAYSRQLQISLYGHAFDDVTMASYPYILAIYDSNQMTVTALSETLRVKKASASQMIDRLVKTGYVERHRHEVDKRSSYITLTERGNRLIETETAVYERFIDQISQSLSVEEWQMFEHLLGRLAERANHES